GGEKIFPEEVEEALKAHPAVEDAVVVGIPDARWGERVTALVRAKEPPGDLEAHCRTLIAGYKVPREIYFVDDLMRHPSGKPDYRWAKAEALHRSSDVTDAWRLAEMSPEGAWGALRQFAAVLRSLNAALVRVDPARADAKVLAELAVQAAALEERVRALPAVSTREAFADGSYRQRPSEFMDRIGLVGWCNPISPPIRLANQGETATGELIFGPTFEG